MRTFLFAAFFALSFSLQGQNTLKIIVTDSASHEPVIGAAVQISGTKQANVTDIDGSVSFKNLPNGQQTVAVSFIGYTTKQALVVLPQTAPLSILLTSSVEDLEVVTVTSTRTNSRIEDIATKVEVLGAEEVEEENSIKPANIASLLGDLSVIHIQQTSQVSGSTSVRMQGLDGKYTQILRDGLPLYEGFSGSFGVLQIPPLDLKQIEIIKGSNSTLYGGGAIGGMINLVSKDPHEATESSLTLNISTLKESNINAYFAKRFGKFGFTFYGGDTNQQAADVNKDGFSDVPKVTDIVLHPRIFYYFNPKTTLKIGVNSTFENRVGGDMQLIETLKTSGTHAYFEKNKSKRNSIDGQFSTETNNHHIVAKGVYSLFDRAVNQSGFLFQGKQKSSFLEVSDFIKIKNHDIVYGANFISDRFDNSNPNNSLIKYYDNKTAGFFLQDGWQITPKWLIETGVRADILNSDNGSGTGKNASFILPRLAILYKASHDFSIRLSGGTGYKVPNIFTQEALSGSFQNLHPLSNSVISERSTSFNSDINYHTLIVDKLGLSLNQAFYWTTIRHPLVLSNNLLQNSNSQVRSIGTDSYLRLDYEEVELYIGYNHTLSDFNSAPILYAPRDKIALTCAYAIEHKWRFGIESSWVANQYLSETVKAPSYWFWAGMVERKFGEHISLVLNSENIFDARQSRKESLFTGSISNPTFTNLYMPIDGRITNLSLRVKM